MAEIFEIDTNDARVQRLRRAVIVRSRLVSESLAASGRRYTPWMVTLTYRDKDGWSPGDIRAFWKRVRSWAKVRGHSMPYVWVAELQKRGAVHYHAIIWLPRGAKLPKSDSKGWWLHGMTNTTKVHTSAVGYLAKYASKLESKCGENFPPGLRLYGSGCLAAVVRLASRWWMLPMFLRSGTNPAHDIVRAKGGGFVSRGLGGLIVPSPWRLVGIAARRVRLALVGPSRLVLPGLAWSGPL